MDTVEAQLKIECERIGSMGQVRVMAQLGDQLLHIDKGDLADSAFRDRFADQLCQDRAGIDRSEVLAELLGLAQYDQRGGTNDKTPRHNSRSKVLSLSEKWEPFPVEHLPEPVRRFVIRASKAIGCDPSFVALPLLAAIASAIGNTRRIQLKRNWSEPAVLWCVVIAESGALKSPAQEIALRNISQKQQDEMDLHKEAMILYEDDLSRYERDLARWRKSNNDEESPVKPQKPTCERVVCSDTTVESLALLLLDNERGILMARDELAGWFGSFNTYKSGRGADEAHWLEMFGARQMIVDRKSTNPPTIYVPRAAVCVAGTIQPQILQAALAKEYFENGLAARLLFSMPPRIVKRWTEMDVKQEDEAALGQIIGNLFSLKMNTDGSGEPCPIDVPLSTEAKTRWIEFYNQHAKEQAELSSDLAAAWSKLEGYAARLALTVHFIRWAGDDPNLADANEIDDKDIEAGIVLSRWFGHETRRVYAVLGESGEVRDQRHHVELIQGKGGSVSLRDWQRIRQHRTSEDAEAELEALVAGNVGSWTSPASRSKGGRPSKIFQLSLPDNDKTPYESLEAGVLSSEEASSNVSNDYLSENQSCSDWFGPEPVRNKPALNKETSGVQEFVV